MTYLGPNSSSPDIMQSASYCVAGQNNPPCTVMSPPNLLIMKFARSRHPGGVNALFADGSVRFIKNSINVWTWRALGTTRGNEIVSSDAY